MAKLWDEPIEVKFPELFTSVEHPGFSEFYEDIDGLRINADILSYEDGWLSVELLVFFAFPREFFSCFKRIQEAIIVVIEDTDTGQCHHLNLLDPHKRYPLEAGPNYEPEVTESLPGKKISNCRIPLQIEVANPGWGPHLFIRATLQTYSSNILAIDISDSINLSSFVDGEPYNIDAALESDDE